MTRIASTSPPRLVIARAIQGPPSEVQPRSPSPRAGSTPAIRRGSVPKPCTTRLQLRLLQAPGAQRETLSLLRRGTLERRFLAGRKDRRARFQHIARGRARLQVDADRGGVTRGDHAAPAAARRREGKRHAAERRAAGGVGHQFQRVRRHAEQTRQHSAQRDPASEEAAHVVGVDQIRRADPFAD